LPPSEKNKKQMLKANSQKNKLCQINMFSIKSTFSRNNILNSPIIPNLTPKLFISITTFICSALSIFVLIKYVIITTHVIEHLDNVLELGVIRPIPNSSVEVSSISSSVANSIVEASSITSTMAVESAPNNVTPNTTNVLIDSTLSPSVNQAYPQSIDSSQSVNTPSTPVHRRIIIIYFIGAVMFLGVNAVVNTLVFVSGS